MVHKACAPTWRVFLLSLSGGGYIALGFVFCMTVLTGSSTMPWGVARLLAGLVFSTGLFLVVVTGADLFTSTSMTLIAKAAGKITWRRLFTHWGLVYFGNFVGSLSIVALMFLGGVHHNAKGEWGKTVLNAAVNKLHHNFGEAFFLGIACNLIVCVAVWAAFSGRTTSDKMLAVALPIALFVSTGFEHSVANMFLMPLAMLLRVAGGADVTAGVQGMDVLTLSNFLFNNLLPVTLGNIVGGGVMIGIYYWLIFRSQAVKALT